MALLNDLFGFAFNKRATESSGAFGGLTGDSCSRKL
jgi:hypothetical protein